MQICHNYNDQRFHFLIRGGEKRIGIRRNPHRIKTYSYRMERRRLTLEYMHAHENEI